VRFEFFNELLEDVASASGVHQVPGFDLRPQVIRLLDALGHCEFDYEGRHVWACPPSLAILPGPGLSQGVLTGARTPALESLIKAEIKKRSAEASIRRTPQSFGSVPLPSVITLSAISSELLDQIARAAGLQCTSSQPAAWRLAAFSASLAEVRESLTFTSREDLNWSKRTFNADELSFRRGQNPAVYRLVEYKNPADQQRQHWLWDGAKAAEVDRDWGRFMVLRNEAKRVLLYDAKRHRAAVPSTTALPPILARALTLCSGRAPRPYSLGANSIGLPAGRQFHVYSGVPQHIIDHAAQKLGQTLISMSCNDGESKLII
jgi:hypothetical protein